MLESPVLVECEIAPGSVSPSWNSCTIARRTAKPLPGRSLGASVTAVEQPLRRAVALIRESVVVSPSVQAHLFGCTRLGVGAEIESPALRIGWAVACIALVHARATAAKRAGPVQTALAWFFDGGPMASEVFRIAEPAVWKAVDASLRELDLNHELWDLLPYVLEPHGHVTRTKLETCERSRATRSAKKSAGVFYTPADLADFLVKCAAGRSGMEGAWLDPACGTGVFLRTVLDLARSQHRFRQGSAIEFAVRSLFGVDLSALSTDLASFVLLADCVPIQPSLSSPFEAWRLLKANFLAGDALRIAPPGRPIQSTFDGDGLVSFEAAFGADRLAGFDHLIMNPPYASIAIDAELSSSWSSLAAKGSTGSADAQTAFTEMLLKFIRPGGAAAAVLPLSIGSNTSTSYIALRRALAEAPGDKGFLFFDREPQALFGEDIKTRNAVLIYQHSPAGVRSIRTSRLLKWTARQRTHIFSTDRLLPIPDLSIERFVPKLGTEDELALYRSFGPLRVASHGTRQIAFDREILSDTEGKADREESGGRVLISATAYNFLNVFLASGLPKKREKPLSSSPVHSIMTPNSMVQNAAIAILASRLAFWLWHVESDGFHVTSEFLKNLPFWLVLSDRSATLRLAELGGQYWREASRLRVDSVNRGKQTSSFHVGYRHPFYDKVDALILEALGKQEQDAAFLWAFVDATVSVDGVRRDRSRTYQETDK